MKVKSLLAVAAVCVLGMSSCSNESTTKIPVYGWQGESGDATETSIQTDFKNGKNTDWMVSVTTQADSM